MKYALCLFIGALMGAAVALMLAPSSGDEMRANIKTQVDAQSARLQEQWQQGYQQVQARIDKLSSELPKKSIEVEPTG